MAANKDGRALEPLRILVADGKGQRLEGDGLMNSTGRLGTSAGVHPWSDNRRGGQLTVGVRVSES
jgi:hypothetical protein